MTSVHAGKTRCRDHAAIRQVPACAVHEFSNPDLHSKLRDDEARHAAFSDRVTGASSPHGYDGLVDRRRTAGHFKYDSVDIGRLKHLNDCSGHVVTRNLGVDLGQAEIHLPTTGIVG